jgi:succinate-semialdehyde dehydrogenase / glutarate-semialdehyde dehydrogenase
MNAAADLLTEQVTEVAATVTLEMGKTLRAAEAEVLKSAMGMRYYAEHAERFMSPEPIDALLVGAGRVWRTWQPIGPVLAVMPWNYPLWQVMRFAAPALMAGNTVLLKHASNVPRTALFLERLYADAGFPEGAFTTLLIEPDGVAEILADPRVVGATVTGSEAAGREVAAAAGHYLKRTVLELGGSDPFVVLPSANVSEAARAAVMARCQNNGQSCIAAKRFIVHADVYDEFLDRFIAGMAAQRLGDPMHEKTHVGPVATERQRDELAGLLKDAMKHGATAYGRGPLTDSPGWWFEPTILTEVTPEMRIYSEEAFGPLAAVYRVTSYAQARELANDSSFGLAASVWTQDKYEQRAAVTDLETGAVFFNGMTASHPAMPFGGVKNSGYGVELSELGLREFCTAKAVWLA